MPRLGVNIDHVATLRQARGEGVPDPVLAALTAEQAGCDGIVCHLREDRRHIQEKDLWALKKVIRTSLNLEMAADPEIVRMAVKVKPDQATLVPERRRELTTEGGLDLQAHRTRLKPVIRELQSAGIRVSLFIDPDLDQVKRAKVLGAPMIELHTGRYAHTVKATQVRSTLLGLENVARGARSEGLMVAAGHGLDYSNVKPVAVIPEIEELNIGFAIVARAVFMGFHQAVQEMAELVHGTGSSRPTLRTPPRGRREVGFLRSLSEPV